VRRTEGFFLPGLVTGLLRGPWEFAMHLVLVAVAAQGLDVGFGVPRTVLGLFAVHHDQVLR